MYENRGCQSIVVPNANSKENWLYKRIDFKRNYQRTFEYVCSSVKNQHKHLSMADHIYVRPYKHTDTLIASTMAAEAAPCDVIIGQPMCNPAAQVYVHVVVISKRINTIPN